MIFWLLHLDVRAYSEAHLDTLYSCLGSDCHGHGIHVDRIRQANYVHSSR